jgi:hypothetical protein
MRQNRFDIEPPVNDPVTGTTGWTINVLLFALTAGISAYSMGWIWHQHQQHVAIACDVLDQY